MTDTRVSAHTGSGVAGGGGPIPGAVARRVKLVVLDVDGVLTDAGVYMGELASGEMVELKRFDIQDGLGVKLLGAAGIDVAIISGRVSQATAIRARELGVEECHQDGDAMKMRVVVDLMARKGVAWEEVAMLGDDLPDLPVLRKVGLPVAVANAIPEVRRVAAWSTSRSGGRGAVREFCRALLEARGAWDALVEAYCEARSGE
jgi:3-deoxy-D-manno-octulosonate 8-phosphate phosphatase (KDO 8-P phosphatase)